MTSHRILLVSQPSLDVFLDDLEAVGLSIPSHRFSFVPDALGFSDSDAMMWAMWLRYFFDPHKLISDQRRILSVAFECQGIADREDLFRVKVYAGDKMKISNEVDLQSIKVSMYKIYDQLARHIELPAETFDEYRYKELSGETFIRRKLGLRELDRLGREARKILRFDDQF